MDEYTAVRIRRIERQVEAILGIAIIGIYAFGIPYISEHLTKHYGWSDGWAGTAAFLIAIGLTAAIRWQADRE